MKRRTFLLISLLLPLSGFGGDAELRVRADTPRVDIPPRPAGRSFLRLPALEYRFTLHLACGPERRPALLSVGIADTRRQFAPPADGSPVAAILNVPEAQLAPLPISDFCATPEGADRRPAGGELTVADAFSAHSTLVCVADDDSESLEYVTTPLSVTLVCDLSEAGGAAREDDTATSVGVGREMPGEKRER